MMLYKSTKGAGISKLPATVNNDTFNNEIHQTNVCNHINPNDSWTFVSWVVLQTFSDL
jgi:hypothetical protein